MNFSEILGNQDNIQSNMLNDMQNNVQRNLNLFILTYIAVFSLIPILTRNVIPFDMVENLYWGKEWQLGYEKHPPLFAWISEIFFKISFSIPESLYVLTQLNLLLGLFFIFKISQLAYNNKTKSTRRFSFLCLPLQQFSEMKNSTRQRYCFLSCLRHFIIF